MTPGGMPLVTGASSAPQAVQTSASGAALSRLPTVAVGTVPKPVPSVSAHPAVVASLPPFKPTEVAMRPYTPPAPIWVLPTGALVGVELAAWGKASGWTVQWNVHQDWSVPQAAQFQGNFEVAATAVLKTIAGQGADIRARFYEGNQILVVDQPGGSYAQ